MISRRILVLALALCAALVSGCNGCAKDEPKSTRWDDAAAEVAATSKVSPIATSSVAAIPAGAFNKFFPKEGAGEATRVFSADKPGFAEAKLQKDGKEVALLSISDAERLLYAKAKFEESTDKLDGFPVIQVGKNQTSVLVKGRYQVKVSSPTLDHDARKAILATFDLKGLEAL